MSDENLDVRLVVPDGLLDLLAPTTDDEARALLTPMVTTTFPRADAHDRQVLLDGLLEWRRLLLDRGVVMHGVVSAPQGTTVEDLTLTTPAHWHLFAAPVPVPVTGEIDPGALLARVLGQQPDLEHAYVEAFPTRMGWGVGLVTTVAGDGVEADSEDGGPRGPGSGTPVLERLGLALALSGRPGSSTGLLVLGACLDSERTVEMAALVALIAGQSTIEPGTHTHATTGSTP